MDALVYYAGSPAEPVDVFFTDADGSLFDFSTGFTFEVIVARFGSPSSFTKVTGVFGATGNLAADPPVPNLRIVWSITPGAELSGLAPGRYVVRIIATPTLGAPLELYGELTVRENAPNYGYCEAADLLIGDTTLPSYLNPFDYVNGAADEINARLGQLYALPLNLNGGADFVQPLLKKINRFLASGRLLMAQGVAGEDNSVNALAAAYIKEAQADLEAIMCGTVELLGVPKLPTSLKGATAPITRNYDDKSAVDAFTDFTSRRRSLTTWRPGPSATTPFVFAPFFP